MLKPSPQAGQDSIRRSHQSSPIPFQPIMTLELELTFELNGVVEP